jgi:deoxycytidylate deaminase
MASEHHPIVYPYIPADRTIKYVPKDNTFILQAKEYARTHALDNTLPTGAVIVKEGEVIGLGANGSRYHLYHECERVKQGCGSGKGYELCEGCNPKNHAEASTIINTLNNGFSTVGADLYLWGDWFCCESCWNYIISAGIKDVYLMEGSERLFHKEHPDNIIGHQFDK